MTHRWIRAASLRSALLAAVVLAALPGSVAAQICDFMCSNQRNSRYSLCNAQFSACIISATDARDDCIDSCGGASSCINNCNSWYLGAKAYCTAVLNSCTGVADELYRQCLDNCPGGGGGGGCGTATQTETATLSLEDTTAAGEELAAAPVNFALSRGANRGAESIILDEWAVVRGGRITASSNPAFALAVKDQRAESAQGSFLIIQEPIHEMNSRHVPKPEVRFSRTGLVPAERGTGGIAAARLELSPAGAVERAEIVYTSKLMDTSRLERLVSRRVGLEFASEKGHRTVVYVVFRLTDRFEPLSTLTILPPCCCGGAYCV